MKIEEFATLFRGYYAGDGPGQGVTIFEQGAEREVCGGCGVRRTLRRGYESANGHIETGYGSSRWVDSIGMNEPVFSERVVQSLYDAGVSGFVAHPFPIEVVMEPTKLDLDQQPDYFWLEITGKVDLDRECYDGGDGLLCGECGRWKPRPEGRVKFEDKLTLPVLESWDGSDLVRIGNIQHGGYYCSAKVVELARRQVWSGMEFIGIAPALPRVNLKSENWLKEFEDAVRAAYPDVVDEG